MYYNHNPTFCFRSICVPQYIVSQMVIFPIDAELPNYRDFDVGIEAWRHITPFLQGWVCDYVGNAAMLVCQRRPYAIQQYFSLALVGQSYDRYSEHPTIATPLSSVVKAKTRKRTSKRFEPACLQINNSLRVYGGSKTTSDIESVGRFNTLSGKKTLRFMQRSLFEGKRIYQQGHSWTQPSRGQPEAIGANSGERKRTAQTWLGFRHGSCKY